MNLIRAFVFFASVFPLTSIGQDPIFTQQYGTSNYNNPAFTGAAGRMRVQSAYRNQSPSLKGNFQTAYLSFDMSRDRMPFDVGISQMYDRSGEGTLQTYATSLSIARSSRIVGNVSVRAGLSAGLLQRSINWGNLTFGDQIDSRYGFIYETKEVKPTTKMRFGVLNAGLVLNGKCFLLGYSISNINEPNQGFRIPKSRLPMRHTVHAAVRILVGDSATMNGVYLTHLYVNQQGFYTNTTGIAYKLGKIKIGVGRSFKSFYVGNLGYVGKNIGVAYSFDLYTSSLTGQLGGAHEITVGWNFGRLHERRPSIQWLGGLF